MIYIQENKNCLIHLSLWKTNEAHLSVRKH